MFQNYYIKKWCISIFLLFSFGSYASLHATPVVMGYWENWGTYHGYPLCGNETLRGQFTGINALAYAFLEVAPDGSIQFTDVWADLNSQDEGTNQFCAQFPQSCPKYSDTQGGVGSFKAFLQLPLTHVISLGSAGHDESFDNAFNNPDQFIVSLKALRSHFPGIDTLDLDYEPVNGIPEDKAQDFADLIVKIKTNLPDMKLSYTLIANHKNIEALGDSFWKKLSQNLDYLGVMGYDMHGAFDIGNPLTAHHASLYSEGDDFSADKTIKTLTALGVDKSKILLGMPMYGRAVGGVAQDGLHEPFTLSYKGDWDDANCSTELNGSNTCSGVMSYKRLVQKGYVAGTQNNYYYDANEKMFVSYDNPATVTEKSLYVKEQGLGGVFFWSMRGDTKITHPQSLLAAVDKVLDIPFYQPDRLSKPKIFSYWAGWANVRIPDFKIDGLILAFASLKKSKSQNYYTDYSASNNFQDYSITGPYATWQLNWLQKFYPQGGRAYLSYGGATDTNIRALIMEATPAELSSIAGEMKENVAQYYFDGIDLDIELWWIYNKEQNQQFARNLATLVKLLRNSLDADPATRDKPIMIAVGGDAASPNISSYTGTMRPFFADSEAVNAISAVFIMSYGLEQNIEGVSGLLETFKNAGVPEETLFVGVSPYELGTPIPLPAIKALGEFVKNNNYGGLFMWAIGVPGLDTSTSDNYLSTMKLGLGL